MSARESLFLLLTGALWGVSTAYMKRGSLGYEHADTLMDKVRVILGQPIFVCAFAVNMCGSVLFYYMLSQSKLSLVVPVVKSIEFLFISLTSWCLSDIRLKPQFFGGIACVFAGIALMTG